MMVALEKQFYFTEFNRKNLIKPGYLPGMQ